MGTGRLQAGEVRQSVSGSMARSEVITLSRAGADIPGFRCEAPSLFIPVPSELLKQQRYDDALKCACDELSALGVRNFIHWEWDSNNEHRTTLVELIGSPQWLQPRIHHHTNTIELRERAHA